MQLEQLLELIGSLDALGDRAEVEDAGELDDRGGERGLLAAFRHAVDEGLVDLQDVDGEAADVVQRGVAGSEVVDRELDAEVLQLGEALVRQDHVLHHHALGDLEHEALGSEPGLEEHARDLLDDLGALELSGREVHRHVQRPRLRVRPAGASSRRGRPPRGPTRRWSR